MRAYWDSLSDRERRLAAITGLLVAVAAIFLVVYRAVGNVTMLDNRIAQLEQELVNLHEQEAASASAEEAFRSMSAQHSSEWTKEEIEDRLRAEIYRLALLDTDTLEPKQEDYMVQIPTLREGTLVDGEEGYREYQLAFRLQPAAPMNVVRFLERIQKSNQSLRINELRLSRAPHVRAVETSLEITRTVLDSDPDAGIEEGPAETVILADGGFETWESGDTPAGWQADGCRTARNAERATEGEQCLEATATRAGGRLYAPVTVAQGRTYRLSFDVSSDTPVVLGIHEPSAPDALAQARRIPGDGGAYRCEFLFTPANAAASEAEVWAPYIEFEETGTRAFLDNVQLTPLGG